MSAITGIFYRDGRTVKPELIKKMNKTLSHRGPDGSAVWCDGSVAFGHQMLWTTPESLHEKLPFEDKGIVITSDARIDNRKELSEELDIEDKEDVSDSYFILKSYEKWGEKCPEHLLGDFAFAIWDQNKEKLFCARDHMGVKPFYYYLNDNMFVFGTEIRALFGVSGVEYELNENKVAFYLMDIDDNKSTFYKNIFSFSSAQSMLIDQHDKKITQYWEINPKSTIIMDSEEEYSKTFREIFTKAVKCRLRRAFPIGFELSGGLDSSSVVGMAKKILNDDGNSHFNMDTFSIIFGDFPECDESYYIKKVLDIGGINSHIVNGDKINPLNNIGNILFYQEQPFFTPFMAVLWKLYEEMQKKDVRVMLCGIGGDAVISYGNNYFRDLAFAHKWKKLLEEIRISSKRVNMNSYDIFLFKVLFPIIPEYIKKLLRPNNSKPSTSILNDKFAKRINAKDYLKKLYWKPISDAKTAKKFHHYLLSTDNLYMLEMLDRTTSSFSIEPRYPFLDKRLVEFCYAIPTEMKFKLGWSRYILRISMEGIIPKENQWRHKASSLEQVYERNLLLFEKDRLDSIINLDNNLIRDYVDLNRIVNIYKQKFIKRTAEYNSIDVWLVLLLFLWLNEGQKINPLNKISL